MKLPSLLAGLAPCAALAFAVAIPAPSALAGAEVPDRPATEAELLDRLSAFEREEQPSDPAYVAALSRLSLLYVNQGRHAEAVPLLRRALAASERIAGPDHPATREIRASLMLAEAFVGAR